LGDDRRADRHGLDLRPRCQKVAGDFCSETHGRTLNSHTGIRLGFSLDMNKRKSSDLRKILYSDDRPVVNMLELNNKKLTEQIMESYRIKSVAWKYEKEVRLLVPIK
jgi:hypothetical protein